MFQRGESLGVKDKFDCDPPKEDGLTVASLLPGKIDFLGPIRDTITSLAFRYAPLYKVAVSSGVGFVTEYSAIDGTCF